MSPAAAVVVVGAAAAGLWLLLTRCAGLRPSLLRARLDRHLGPSTAEAVGLARTAQLVLGAPLATVWEKVARSLADPRAARRLVARAGRDDVEAHLRERAAWGLFGAVAGCGLVAVAVGTGWVAAGPLALVGAIALAPAGLVAFDQRLRRAADRRSAAIEAALPGAADLLCLAVTAGESTRAALQRTADIVVGPLAGELRRVLADSGAGGSLEGSLRTMHERTGLASVGRLVDSVVVASDRGMPLAASLAALAEDLRSGEQRRLLEAAGRRQVAMLLPVIGLILPAALLFAFYPAFVSLQELVS